MRRIIAYCLEMVILEILWVFLWGEFLRRGMSEKNVAFLLIVMLLAVAVAKITEGITMISFKLKTHSKKTILISFFLVSAVFLVAYMYIEKTLNMPASKEYLMIISLITAASHLLLSHFLDAYMQRLMKSFKERFRSKNDDEF